MKVLLVDSLVFLFGLILITQVIIPAINGTDFFWFFRKQKEKPVVKIDSIEKLKEDTEEVVEDFHEKKMQAEEVSKQLKEIKEKFNQ